MFSGPLLALLLRLPPTPQQLHASLYFSTLAPVQGQLFTAPHQSRYAKVRSHENTSLTVKTGLEEGAAAAPAKVAGETTTHWLLASLLSSPSSLATTSYGLLRSLMPSPLVTSLLLSLAPVNVKYCSICPGQKLGNNSAGYRMEGGKGWMELSKNHIGDPYNNTQEWRAGWGPPR